MHRTYLSNPEIHEQDWGCSSPQSSYKCYFFFGLITVQCQSKYRMMLFREWRWEPRTSLCRHWACHQFTSASTPTKYILAVVTEVAGTAGAAKGNVKQSSSSSSAQSGKTTGYQIICPWYVECILRKRGWQKGFITGSVFCLPSHKHKLGLGDTA